jgi:TatD DNase family protein
VKLVDAHCHLESSDFADLDSILSRARATGLVHAVVVGQFHGPGDFGNALAIASAHPDFLTATMGIHPHDAARATEEDLKDLEALCAKPEVRAVGETGLDYHYDHSPRPAQLERFAWQCQMSHRVSKPLVVHVRDAHSDCANVLSSEKIQRGMIHCFTGDTDAARRYLDLGLYLSISGVVTYKKTESLREAVRFAPLERLLIETDSPF